MGLRRAILALALPAAVAGCSNSHALTVCADPNNMPFSNRRGEGIENKLAMLLAHDLGRELRYYWWAQRRGFVRNTTGQDKCDAWLGVPAQFDRLKSTRPYYRSTYVFVTRAEDRLDGLTFDDPRLRKLKLGVPMGGDDGANPPPANALARRGLIAQVRGFPLYGDYREANPPTAILRALQGHAIDVAIVWGPIAGWYAKSAAAPLHIEPVSPSVDEGQWPMTFAIAVGVPKDDDRLRGLLDNALDRNRRAIAGLLASYAVPVLPEAG